jgi:hypothetical protein
MGQIQILFLRHYTAQLTLHVQFKATLGLKMIYMYQATKLTLASPQKPGHCLQCQREDVPIEFIASVSTLG